MRAVWLASTARGVAFAAMACAYVAGPASAQPSPAWNADRARLFSQVCMKAAPQFDRFAALAGQAGFRQKNGNLMFPPEVAVSLRQVGGACSCYMTMGAPEPEALVTAIFERMVTDFPGAWQPGARGGAVNDSVFLRDGVALRVRLTPTTYANAPWIAATATVLGRCPQ